MSLCYQPAPGLINVGIIAARSLKAKDLNGRSGTVYIIVCSLKCAVFFVEDGTFGASN